MTCQRNATLSNCSPLLIDFPQVLFLIEACLHPRSRRRKAISLISKFAHRDLIQGKVIAPHCSSPVWHVCVCLARYLIDTFADKEACIKKDMRGRSSRQSAISSSGVASGSEDGNHVAHEVSYNSLAERVCNLNACNCQG